jgi:hypothetical protein
MVGADLLGGHVVGTGMGLGEVDIARTACPALGLTEALERVTRRVDGRRPTFAYV